VSDTKLSAGHGVRVPVYRPAPFSYGSGRLVLVGSCNADGHERLEYVRHGDAAGEIRAALIVGMHVDLTKLSAWVPADQQAAATKLLPPLPCDMEAGE
jgi:hypothetical protein